MNLYFDTSALVKFFHFELGTQAVSELVGNPENYIFISELARIEFHCALYRRFRNGELPKKDLTDALDGFNKQINDFHIEKLGSVVVQEAERLLTQYAGVYGLRTLDALHLATFNLISEKNWRFVSSDKQLNSVVKKMGFRVIEPHDSGAVE